MNLLIKAGHKDISKLVPVIIVDKKGRKMTVYVKPEEEETIKKMSHEEVMDKIAKEWGETFSKLKELKDQVKELEDNAEKLGFSLQELSDTSGKIGDFIKESQNFIIKISNKQWTNPGKYKDGVAFLMSKVSAEIAAQAQEIIDEGRKAYVRSSIDITKKAVPNTEKLKRMLKEFNKLLDSTLKKMRSILK
jgi:predicted translin family RNA/ssDNA-binding protein